MSHPVEIRFIAAADAPDLRSARGRVALLVGEQGRPPAGLPGAARQALTRALASEAWRKVKPGEAMELSFPAGMEAEAIQLVHLPRRADALVARKAGAAIGARMGKGEVTVIAGNHPRAADIAMGLALRGYDFSVHKTQKKDEAADATHHDHLIDVETGRVIEFVDEELEFLQRRIAEKLGFRLVDHRMELYGVALSRKA